MLLGKDKRWWNMRRTAFITFVLLLAGLTLTGCSCQQTRQETVEQVETAMVTEIVEVEPVEVIKTVMVQVQPTSETSAQEIPVTLNLNYKSDPPSLDPARGTSSSGIDLASNLFVSLTRLHPQTSVVEPYLATDWWRDYDDDGNPVWTFTLRNDIPWVHYDPVSGITSQVIDEDGNPRFVTAYDVEYGVKRSIDPAVASEYAYFLYTIKNAYPINAGEEGYTLDMLGVKALDESTIQYTLEYEAAYFPAIAGMWVGDPVPQWAIEEWGDKWTEAGLIHTNGPYVLESWFHDLELSLVKNPLWPKAGQVQIERVEGVMVGEESTAFTMYENDELDTVIVPLRDIDRIKADPVLGSEFYTAPDPCTMYLGFTNNKPPLDDVRVRRALTQAIDRQSLIDNILKGGQIPATSFAPPGIFGAPPPGEVGLQYDPEAAKASLQEYLDEKDQTIDDFNQAGISMMYWTSENIAFLSAAIQHMWVDTLGVKVEMENQEGGVYWGTIKGQTPLQEMPHVWWSGWCADYPDENNWVHEVFNTLEGDNTVRRNCLDATCQEVYGTEFDELTKAAALENDPAKRVEMYAEAERILAEEEVAYAPLYHAVYVVVTKPWLQRNYPAMSMDDYYNWKIDMQAKLEAQDR